MLYRFILVPLSLLLVCVLPVTAGAFTYLNTHEAEGVSLHKPTWIMPASWANEYPHEKTEAVFQISLKKQVMQTGLYLAYTQKSFWQVYNTEESAPFRETNYNPEIFYRIKPGNALARYLGDGPLIGNLGMDIGIEHESNGQSMPGSRSWDRAYITPYYANGNILIYIKAWYITEASQKKPTSTSNGSDNPDILDYMGYGEFNIKYQGSREEMIHLMARGNPKTHKGAISLTWSIPIRHGGVFLMIRGFHGYGESLIDYNRSVSRVGVGFMFCR